MSNELSATAWLSVEGLSARYGKVEALRPVDITLARGELVAVLGPNGAGKSTLLRAIMGLTPGEGRVRFDGKELPRGDAQAVTTRGVIPVPEGRGIFGPMTVRENLDLGAYLLGNQRGEIRARLERVFALFPRLQDRQTQLAGSLSGGEQQMLAIGLAQFFARSRTGRAMRACSINREAAALQGIPVARMLGFAFALPAGLGAVAGRLITPTQYTAFNAGVPFAISGFIAAIVGGFGSAGGACAGGIMLGVAQAAAIVLFGAGYKNVAALSILLVFLLARPAGLFGKSPALFTGGKS